MDDQTLDLRGLKCPLPVLRTRKAMRGLAPGTRLWVETTDPLALIDVPNFCREDGHALIESAADEGFHRFLIERGS